MRRRSQSWLLGYAGNPMDGAHIQRMQQGCHGGGDAELVAVIMDAFLMTIMWDTKGRGANAEKLGPGDSEEEML